MSSYDPFGGPYDSSGASVQHGQAKLPRVAKVGIKQGVGFESGIGCFRGISGKARVAAYKDHSAKNFEGARISRDGGEGEVS